MLENIERSFFYFFCRAPNHWYEEIVTSISRHFPPRMLRSKCEFQEKATQYRSLRIRAILGGLLPCRVSQGVDIINDLFLTIGPALSKFCAASHVWLVSACFSLSEDNRG